MAQRSMHATTTLPRPPRLPSFYGDSARDAEPSVIVLDDLDLDDGSRETLEVGEDDIVTRKIDPEARRALKAHLRKLAHDEATPTPGIADAAGVVLVARPRPALFHDPNDATVQSASRRARAEAAAPKRAPGFVLALALGALAFFAGWRITGGEGWLARSALRPYADQASATIGHAASQAIAFVSSSR